MYVCIHARMYAHVYVCTYEFPDDNKQEIFETKLFNIFVSVPLNNFSCSFTIYEQHLSKTLF